MAEEKKVIGTPFKKGNKAAEKWTEQKALDLGNELIEWLAVPKKENIFFEYFLIVEKGLYPEIIDYLSKKFPAFLKLIVKAKRIQEIKLVKYGVEDKLNPNMTKFCLINHHEYSDKKDIEHSGGFNFTGIEYLKPNEAKAKTNDKTG